MIKFGRCISITGITRRHAVYMKRPLKLPGLPLAFLHEKKTVGLEVCSCFLKQCRKVMMKLNVGNLV